MAKNEMIEAEAYTGSYTPDLPSANGANFDNINQGTVAVESSRAIAEAQGKLIIAKKFPRDEVQAYAKAMQACQRPKMAASAFYSYPRGGSTVSGASIRFAEELARCWGNVDYGIKELSRDGGKSEMQAYAWDMETNTISVQNFTNPHQRESGGKMMKLTSDRDIYEINANMAARRLRARILAVLPNWFVEDCINECKKTLAGKNETPLIDRVRNMLVQFERFSVTKEMIEKRLNHTIETTTQDEFVDLVGIFNSIKDKQSSVVDWFEQPKQKAELNILLDAEDEKEGKN
jgi:hypothetical protein